MAYSIFSGLEIWSNSFSTDALDISLILWGINITMERNCLALSRNGKPKILWVALYKREILNLWLSFSHSSLCAQN